MTFQNALDTHFPNSLPQADFVQKTHALLSAYGFSADNAIACVSVCRDELTKPLIDLAQQTWGEAFNFSSLAGMIFLGKTGFSAAHAHAPVESGLEHYVYYAMPHIAIDEDGTIGVCYRDGREGQSSACGALVAFQQALANDALNLTLDFDDIEQSLLTQKMHKALGNTAVTDLSTITKTAQQVILQDLEHFINLTVDTTQSNYAVLTGIQIHGPNKAQYVWPTDLYVVQGGEKVGLGLT